MTENLITRLLAEAAARAEKEKRQRRQQIGKQGSEENRFRKVHTKEVIKGANSISHVHKDYIYPMEFLESLERSPLCEDISHLTLPRKEFYRLNAKTQQGRNFFGNVNASGNLNTNANGNGNGDANGNSINHRNGRRQQNSRRDRAERRRGGVNRKEHQQRYDRYEEEPVDGLVEEDDEWIRKNDEPTGNSMEDFERWRLKMRIETFKRNGEPIPVEDMDEYKALMKRKGGKKEEKMKSVDNEFASIPLNIAPINESATSSRVTSGAHQSASKFSMFFHEDDKTVDPIGSSRLMSMLRGDEEKKQTSMSPEIHRRPLDPGEPGEPKEPVKPRNRDLMFLQTLLSKSKPSPGLEKENKQQTSPAVQNTRPTQPMPPRMPFIPGQMPPFMTHDGTLGVQGMQGMSPGMLQSLPPGMPQNLPPGMLQNLPPGMPQNLPPGMPGMYPPAQMFVPMGPPSRASGPTGAKPPPNELPPRLPPFMMNMGQQPAHPQMMYENQYGRSQPR
ncbi:hypothetical protein FOA43_001922 [Brettanomyces nanus]|uniref:Uncharacterized protein n=1 Tax=Eeniella nana TaxID=13502 RepID=A0A875RYI5_EENNA|nr:uncharacterized protein FOA43_001922 [Brettanomyces nanus]QPG74591.1 hypothetical protein FOA43_001922 [Brettanomyces nanus]